MKLLITGDFCPVRRLSKLHDLETVSLFGDFHHSIQEADFAITNLECPLTSTDSQIKKTGPALKASPSWAETIKRSGFNLVTLANNHILDYGKKGLSDTLHALDQNKLPYIGATIDSPHSCSTYTFSHDDKQISILNFAENEWSTLVYNGATASAIDPVSNFNAIQEARENSHYVIVITHGGHEMYNLPSPSMKKLLRFYVDAGADSVINHHPHVTSGYEVYKEKPIFYSLGNFLFDHPDYRNSDWNKGFAVLLHLNKQKLKFELYHYDQSNDEPELVLCNTNETDKRNNEIKKLNEVILSDIKLESVFKEFVKYKKKQYSSYIEPHPFKYIQALQNRGLVKSIWSDRKKKYLLNLIRCESHNEILKAILENDVRKT